MQAELKRIEATETVAVALTADAPEVVKKTAREWGLMYAVASDASQDVITRYGVRHPEEGISRPAVFIIDKAGIVRYAYVGKDFADRPATALLVNVLRWL